MNPKTQREIEVVKLLDQITPPAKFEPSWLSQNASQAFLICLGAGPWKIARRKNVQQHALDWLSDQITEAARRGYCDLGSPDLAWCDQDQVFPLRWQNQMLNAMIKSLNEHESMFSDMCARWKNLDLFDHWSAQKQIFTFAGRSFFEPTIGKCLWLFMRDYLQIPAFPIDRHVADTLRKFELPVNSWEMLQLCELAGVSANSLARRMFTAENPNWSEYAV